MYEWYDPPVRGKQYQPGFQLFQSLCYFVLTIIHAHAKTELSCVSLSSPA